MIFQNITINKLNNHKLTNIKFIKAILLFYICSITLFLHSAKIEIKNSNELSSFSHNMPSHKIFDFHNVNQNVLSSTITYINNYNIKARQINNIDFVQNYIVDQKNSVLKLIYDNKNNQTYTYDAYGNIIISSQTTNSIFLINKHDTEDNKKTITLSRIDTKNQTYLIPNYFKYNAERFDDNTNLEYLQSRFYSVYIKRFIAEDTYNLLNRFSYTSSNPVMQNDPTGHMGCICIREAQVEEFDAAIVTLRAHHASENQIPTEGLNFENYYPTTFEELQQYGIKLGSGAFATVWKYNDRAYKILDPYRSWSYSSYSYPLSNSHANFQENEIPESSAREAHYFNRGIIACGHPDYATANIHTIKNESDQDVFVLSTPILDTNIDYNNIKDRLKILDEKLWATGFAVLDSNLHGNLAQINGDLVCIDYGMAVNTQALYEEFSTTNSILSAEAEPTSPISKQIIKTVLELPAMFTQPSFQLLNIQKEIALGHR